MQAPSRQQLAALAVVLDHPGLASDPLLLCSAERVCVSWQEAVAASGAGTTNITVRSSTPDPSLEGPDGSESLESMLKCDRHFTMQRRRTQGLPIWLARHAHLVHGLRFSGSLGRCAAYALAESCADPYDAGAGLELPRLKQFSADSHATPMLQPELLAALPDGLSELELTGVYISEEDDDDSCTDSVVKVLLQRLEQLKVLHISGGSASEPLDLSPLSGMCHLTRLKLSGMEAEAHWIDIEQALPCLTALQDLHLDCYRAFDCAAGRALPLGGLTGLQHLYVSLGFELPGPGTQLPAQLSALEPACDGLRPLGSQKCSGCPVAALGLPTLSYLRHLKMVMSTCPLDYMSGSSVALQQLTQVTHLELEYQCVWASSYDDDYWGMLPALRTLRFTNELAEESLQVGAAESIFAGVAHATSLVHLEMVVEIDVSTQKEHNCLSLGFCQQLTGLTKLQVLQLQLLEGDIAARDCMHLSSLSNLTRPDLRYFDGPVDDAVAVALALSLPQLRHLDLTGCGLQTDAVLAALAQREQLTELQLSDNSGLSDDVLADIRQFNAEGSPSLRSILLRSGTTREDAG